MGALPSRGGGEVTNLSSAAERKRKMAVRRAPSSRRNGVEGRGGKGRGGR
jgi:hypothetical protein